MSGSSGCRGSHRSHGMTGSGRRQRFVAARNGGICGHERPALPEKAGKAPSKIVPVTVAMECLLSSVSCNQRVKALFLCRLRFAYHAVQMYIKSGIGMADAGFFFFFADTGKIPIRKKFLQNSPFYSRKVVFLHFLLNITK